MSDGLPHGINFDNVTVVNAHQQLERIQVFLVVDTDECHMDRMILFGLFRFSVIADQLNCQNQALEMTDSFILFIQHQFPKGWQTDEYFVLHLWLSYSPLITTINFRFKGSHSPIPWCRIRTPFLQF